MKKIVLIIIILLVGCTKEKEENKIVEMKIKENTLTNEKMTIIIENNTENNIIVKPNFEIEKKQDNKWNKLKKNECKNTLGYGIDRNNKMEIEISWICEYEKLEKGTYRIIKYLENDEYIKTEFEI